MNLRDEGGFSIIELLIVLATSALLLGGTFAVLQTTTTTEATIRERVDTMADARVGISRLTKELRQALSVSPSSTRSRIEIEALVNGSPMQVVWDAGSGTLTRAVAGGAAVPVTTGLQTSTIFCYDAPSCSAASPASQTPAVVTTTLTMRPTTGGQPLTVSMDVQLRNSPSA